MAVKEKKKPPFTFKELFFAYLAISKLMYWVDNIAVVSQDGFIGVVELVVNRLINQDIMVVWILVAMFLLDHYIETHPNVSKSWLKKILLYGIGYAIYISSILLYMLILALLPITGLMGIDALPAILQEVIVAYSIFYVIACVFLFLKDGMKKKEAEKYIQETITNEDSLVMLTTLCERGVITQEEFECKKEICQKDAQS